MRMFTTTPPNAPTDRTRLFPSPAAAGPLAAEGRPIFEVAVRFDAWSRRVVPVAPAGPTLWLAWTTPGEAHADDSVTARGVIPPDLYTGLVAPTSCLPMG